MWLVWTGDRTLKSGSKMIYFQRKRDAEAAASKAKGRVVVVWTPGKADDRAKP